MRQHWTAALVSIVASGNKNFARWPGLARALLSASRLRLAFRA